jgi:hypothetical protein
LGRSNHPRRGWLAFVAAAAFSAPVYAGEYAILSSGLRLYVDRHERTGDMVRLFRHEGVTEMPASVVAGFEPEDYVPPPPAVGPSGPARPVETPGSTAADPLEMIRAAARKSGLPPEFVQSVAKVESAFRPDAISPKGAIGVMQLMPATARALGVDPRDTGQNIDAGARLLRELLLKYDGDVVKALAAYNAGEGAVDRYRGLPPFNETRHYVNKVIGEYQQAGGK